MKTTWKIRLILAFNGLSMQGCLQHSPDSNLQPSEGQESENLSLALSDTARSSSDSTDASSVSAQPIMLKRPSDFANVERQQYVQSKATFAHNLPTDSEITRFVNSRYKLPLGSSLNYYVQYSQFLQSFLGVKTASGIKIMLPTKDLVELVDKDGTRKFAYDDSRPYNVYKIIRDGDGKERFEPYLHLTVPGGYRRVTFQNGYIGYKSKDKFVALGSEQFNKGKAIADSAAWPTNEYDKLFDSSQLMASSDLKKHVLVYNPYLPKEVKAVDVYDRSLPSRLSVYSRSASGGSLESDVENFKMTSQLFERDLPSNFTPLMFKDVGGDNIHLTYYDEMFVVDSNHYVYLIGDLNKLEPANIRGIPVKLDTERNQFYAEFPAIDGIPAGRMDIALLSHESANDKATALIAEKIDSAFGQLKSAALSSSVMFTIQSTKTKPSFDILVSPTVVDIKAVANTSWSDAFEAAVVSTQTVFDARKDWLAEIPFKDARLVFHRSWEASSIYFPEFDVSIPVPKMLRPVLVEVKTAVDKTNLFVDDLGYIYKMDANKFSLINHEGRPLKLSIGENGFLATVPFGEFPVTLRVDFAASWNFDQQQIMQERQTLAPKINPGVAHTDFIETLLKRIRI